jgi:hypothetical protein
MWKKKNATQLWTGFGSRHWIWIPSVLPSTIYFTLWKFRSKIWWTNFIWMLNHSVLTFHITCSFAYQKELFQQLLFIHSSLQFEKNDPVHQGNRYIGESKSNPTVQVQTPQSKSKPHSPSPNPQSKSKPTVSRSWEDNETLNQKVMEEDSGVNGKVPLTFVHQSIDFYSHSISVPSTDSTKTQSIPLTTFQQLKSVTNGSP